MSLRAFGRWRLAWLDRFIVPRETPLAPSRWHQHIVVWPILGARGSRPAPSPAGAA